MTKSKTKPSDATTLAPRKVTLDLLENVKGGDLIPDKKQKIPG
jgi:hypothetical protein